MSAVVESTFLSVVYPFPALSEIEIEMIYVHCLLDVIVCTSHSALKTTTMSNLIFEDH